MNLYPLNVLVIVYEMSWQLEPRYSTLLAKRTLFLCWVVAAIGATFTIFTTEYVTNDENLIEGKCITVRMF